MEQRRLDRLESELGRLADRLATLEGRLSRLEERPGPGAAGTGTESPEAWEPALFADGSGAAAGRAWATLAPLLGRTLLILGGAYLLRALTELEAVPDPAGVALGLAYAVVWLALAARAERTSAGFHAAVAALVGYPLLWEANTRFAIVGSVGAGCGVVALTLVALAVAARRELRAVAWLAAVGGAITSLALLRAAPAPLAPVAALVTVGVAVLWTAYMRRWPELPWVGAGFADLGVLVLVVGADSGRLEVANGPVVALLLGFFAAWVVSFGLRTLQQGHEVGLFEVAQTIAAVVLGYEGAIRLASGAGQPVALLGLAGVAVGAAAYGVAFSPGVRSERRRNFLFYSSLGLLLVLAGSELLLPSLGAALAWSALAVACAWASGRLGRVTLSLHSAVYVLAAVVVSGGVRAAGEALLLPDPPTWTPFGAGLVAVLVAAAVCLALPTAQQSPSWGRWARLPRAALWLAVAWLASGALCWLLAPAIAGGGADFDPAALAALRTGVIVLMAVLYAAAGRRERFAAAGWLAYPLLGLAGLEVLLVALPGGRPLTQFVALALLGTGLMMAARLRRQSRPAG